MPMPVSLTDITTDVVVARDGDIDVAAGRCEFHGVRQQIHHDLAERAASPRTLHGSAAQIDREADLLLVELEFDRADAVAHDAR